jgi:hypothetical protein
MKIAVFWVVAPCSLVEVYQRFFNRHFHVKLTPEFFDAKLIICITFSDNPG